MASLLEICGSFLSHCNVCHDFVKHLVPKIDVSLAIVGCRLRVSHNSQGGGNLCVIAKDKDNCEVWRVSSSNCQSPYVDFTFPYKCKYVASGWTFIVTLNGTTEVIKGENIKIENNMDCQDCNCVKLVDICDDVFSEPSKIALEFSKHLGLKKDDALTVHFKSKSEDASYVKGSSSLVVQKIDEASNIRVYLAKDAEPTQVCINGVVYQAKYLFDLV